jgi:16S rRNA processing protein RimM
MSPQKRHYKEGYTAVAKLLKPFALKGYVKTQPLSFDFFRYKDLSEICLFNPHDGSELNLKIDHAYDKQDYWYLHFEMINSPEEIAKYRNWEIIVPDAERSPLPEGMYYFSDLVGLEAINDEGVKIGAKVLEARENPANDIILFRHKGKTIIAPWIEECIGEINLEENTIVLHTDFLADIYDF